MSINRSIIVGRMVKDPELRYSANGVGVVNFTVAVNRTYDKENADFIGVVAFKKQAENVATYLKKGSLVGVDGRIQTRNYENNEGRTVYVTEVVADSVQFLETRKNQDEQQKPTYDDKPIDISSDDLPF